MIRHRIRRLESRADACGPGNSGPALPARSLQTAQDVIDLLEEQVEQLRAASWIGTLEKSRAIAILAAIARKAIETGHLAARLELLETVLKQRSEKTKR